MYVIYDATFDGLLSASAYCFRNDVKPDGMISAADERPIVECIDIPREANIHRLFQRHLRRVCGEEAGDVILDTAFKAFLSELPYMADQIWHFLSRALDLRQDPSPRLFEPAVSAVVYAARKVGGQAHQFQGLLRFKEVFPLFLLADFTPDYHVLPLILPHFADRLGGQCFAIRDLRRRIVAFHPPGGPVSIHILTDEHMPALEELPDSALQPAEPMRALPPVCAEETKTRPPVTEAAFEEMWRKYLKHLSIPERYNPVLQKHNLPKKYWKYLVENPGTNNTSGHPPAIPTDRR
jgi:probable DNA metabolism protein